MSLRTRLTQAIQHSTRKRSDLTRAVKVTRATVAQWFNGDTTDMKGDNLFAVADYLGVNARWLATGKGSMVPSPQALASQLSDDAVRLSTRYMRLSDKDQSKLVDYLELIERATA